MTENEKNGEIAKNVIAYSESQKTAACLLQRLRRFRENIDLVIENAARIDALQEVLDATDPREDARSLSVARKRNVELMAFFKTQGMDNIIN